MTLIKSISGIRGTIGGQKGDNLTPIDLVKFSAAYAAWVKKASKDQSKITVIVGRDARISGSMVSSIVEGTLLASGIDVINIGLASTPTVEIAVTEHHADGGIILTASHNPKQWNALKLLNRKGEFLNDYEGRQILSMAESEDFTFAEIDNIGNVISRDPFNEEHVDMVMGLPFVELNKIKEAKLKIVVDGVNSIGGVIIPALLKRLGVDVVKLNCDPTGHFAHNPEPIPENLTQICSVIKEVGADLGIVVDPDVDRLAIINEDGTMFGEEYTLVAVADYVLSKVKGNTVSNLSSSRALRDVTLAHGGEYFAAAVGEVNVVAKMKEVNAVIGGEGNGGVIYPASHYGRDALVGVVLFLTSYVEKGLKCSELKATYPQYFISKNRIDLTPTTDVSMILSGIKSKYASEKITNIDGVKIDFEDEWVHLRSSNTEPIIRIYSESKTMEAADALAQKICADIKELMGA
ncbi:MAG: phosphoglucosamine mutase [Rikenellaceae bacterium]